MGHTESTGISRRRLLAMADNLPQEAPEAFAKAVIDVDGS